MKLYNRRISELYSYRNQNCYLLLQQLWLIVLGQEGWEFVTWHILRWTLRKCILFLSFLNMQECEILNVRVCVCVCHGLTLIVMCTLTAVLWVNSFSYWDYEMWDFNLGIKESWHRSFTDFEEKNSVLRSSTLCLVVK